MAARLSADSALKMIDKIKGNVREMKEGDKKFVNQISVPIYADVIRHFKDEEGEDGPWEEWSDEYFFKMAEKGRGDNQILQYNGRLKNTFKPRKWKRGKDGVVWYNNAKTKDEFPYAFAHNEGGDTLPKRDFMWLSGAPMNLISQVAARYFVDGIGD